MYSDHVQYLSYVPIDQYMAFGISGNNTGTSMVGADVVVAWVDNGVANAVDYYLTSRQQVKITLAIWETY